MGDEIEIVLLGQPRGKERPRFSKASGAVYTPQKTQSYEAALKFAAQQVMGDRPPLEGPLELDIVAVMPVPKSWPKRKRADALANRIRPISKPDWDNFGKVLDAGNLVLWIDDSQVVDGRVRKHYGEKPGMWITVRPIAPGAEGAFA
ncbi:RusA family crossover junction endodeoxyribonuclease [Aurantimonas sp. MSK8Z-1]|uniref:RusA family crossover junction endodeoxyribonuclease n=1 Tax=Mangrovibrevibacter kandeliae TaxID=2968473 RepID=UPI0021195B69|nr:RusA family crossover junction endodeoxyribonuclease [Aurantimonas sp. MSK8Z-1]MCW4115628.1 RusA family crossover junction endodeoxyribonuclease [Aurantimonas sp. MSK8Z-1]